MADIKKIKLPGVDTAYDIVDAGARTLIDGKVSKQTGYDLVKVANDSSTGTSVITEYNGDAVTVYTKAKIDDLLDVSAILKFKGTKANEAAILALTNQKVGWVWLALDTHIEYVCIKDIGATADPTAWEKLGNIHDLAHTHKVEGSTATASVSGTAAAQVWTQGTGTVSGTAAAQTWTQKTGSAAAQAWTQSTGSAAAQVWTQKSGAIDDTATVTVAGSNASSAVSGTAAAQTWTQKTGTISGSVTIPTISSTSKKLSATTVSNADDNKTVAVTSLTVADDTFVKSYPGSTNKLDQVSITAFKDGGTAASWTGVVDADGVLTIGWTANTIATGESKTVGAGTVSGSGAGSEVLVGLGTAVTADAVTSVTATGTSVLGANTTFATTIASGATGDVDFVDTVTIGSTSGSVSGSATVTGENASSTVSGTAAAQTWTQGTSSVSGSVTITGENAASAVTVTGTNAASAVTVTGENATSDVSGSATVTGTNAASAVDCGTHSHTVDITTGGVIVSE